MISGVLHLAHHVAGDENGPPLGGEPAEQHPDPADALRVEAVDGFVEDQHGRITEQGGGDAEALLHAQGVAGRPFAGGRGQSDLVENRVHARAADAVAAGECGQVVVAAQGPGDGAGIEQCADLVERAAQRAVGAAADDRRSGGGCVETEDQPQRGRLSRSVGTQKTGHPAGLHLDREPVERGSGGHSPPVVEGLTTVGAADGADGEAVTVDPGAVDDGSRWAWRGCVTDRQVRCLSSVGARSRRWRPAMRNRPRNPGIDT